MKRSSFYWKLSAWSAAVSLVGLFFAVNIEGPVRGACIALNLTFFGLNTFLACVNWKASR